MKIGIIGGSGLYEMAGLKDVQPVHVATPFGAPSDAYHRGFLGDTEVVFLARHGRGHRKLPSEINHRANIFGFKCLGVDRIVGVTAVGSLREELRPRDIVLPDQYYDRTKRPQEHTFFGNGIVAHVSFGEPICGDLREQVFHATEKAISSSKAFRGLQVRDGGTYVNMEGPAFSTKAESHVYRQLGFDIIGMTSLAEAKLCREAEICYAAMSMVTDYDCWHQTIESVTVEMVIETLKSNTLLAHEILRTLAVNLREARDCTCGRALMHAIITDPADIPNSARTALKPLIGKYVR